MIIRRVLDEVLSTWSNIAVMRTLRYSADGMTGRAISKAAGMTPKAALSALTHLEGLGLVKRIRGGRDHIFTLNRESFLIKNSILPLFESEDTYREEIKTEIVNALKKLCVSLYEFGSVARHEETAASDYDLCIVYEGATVSEKLEESAYELSGRLLQKFGITLAPFYISMIEFKKRVQNKKPPLAGIAAEGMLLWGKQLIGREHDEKNTKSRR